MYHEVPRNSRRVPSLRHSVHTNTASHCHVPHSCHHCGLCVTTAEGGGEGGEGTDEGEEGASGGGGGSGDAGPCREPGEVLGGHWACSELAWGRMCRASCLPGFVMTADPPSPLYICGRHTGQWYPSAHLPTCTRKFLSSRSCSLTCPPALLCEYFTSLHSTRGSRILCPFNSPPCSLSLS